MTRSEMMSRIRSKDTAPEMKLRKALHAMGFRFRLHDRALPGSPDIILPKHRSVIFAHGCFWHGHEGCQHFRIPKTRPEFWIGKINANKIRDKRAVDRLLNEDWRVLVVWECAMRAKDGAGVPNEVAEWLRGSQVNAELSAEVI